MAEVAAISGRRLQKPSPCYRILTWKMNRTRIIKLLCVFFTLGISALAIFWFSGHRPLANHNSRLHSAIGHASRLELRIDPRYGPDGTSIVWSKPVVTITDRSEIDRTLRNFELPWYQRASGRFHECDGHLRITIVMPDASECLIRYDHGKGIYPISTGGDSPGFSELPLKACSKLNSYFNSIGYSNRDLGF